MTQRHEAERHRHQLDEIRKIIESMKTLAYIETHKLDAMITAQHALATDIDAAALDFISAWPDQISRSLPPEETILLIGSQRGFCGDFNESLVDALNREIPANTRANRPVIAIGQKLEVQLDGESGVSVLDGASVAEEIDSVVQRVVNSLASQERPVMALRALYHSVDDPAVRVEQLLPPFMHIKPDSQHFRNPPLLNLPPAEFLLELTDQYLFSALRRIFYDALMAENQQRMTHLEAAINHLDDRRESLGRRINTLRQEEIIEEIEVILLNASAAPG